MKFLINTLFIFVLFACSSDNIASETDHVGNISSSALLAEFKAFKKEYDDYLPSEQSKEYIANLTQPVEVSVYFGTWCHDSEREVPRLIKLAEKAENLSVSLYGLDREKSDPEGKAEQNKVKYTPTMIIFVDGKEVGRIVESPKATIAEDIYLAVSSLG